MKNFLKFSLVFILTLYSYTSYAALPGGYAGVSAGLSMANPYYDSSPRFSAAGGIRAGYNFNSTVGIELNLGSY